MIVLGFPIGDPTGGFRAFRAHTLQGLDISDVASQGYCFQIDLAWRAVQRGFRVVEVPITFVEREHGVSKMNRGIVTEALWRVTAWGFEHRIGRLRRRSRKELAPSARV
jgi:dolichol-phosphate mannosyltransferase